MTSDEAVTFLLEKAEEAKGPWTPYDYPAWAAVVENASAEFLEHQDDEDIADALLVMAKNLRKSRNAILDGQPKPDPDGELVNLREALQAPRAHFWLWPEKLK